MLCSLRVTVGHAPVTLLGVGPGREQVIWTEAGEQTQLGGGAPVADLAG